MTATQSVREIQVSEVIPSLDNDEDYEEAANGKAVVVLSDGSRWSRVHPSGFSLTDPEQERTIDALCEEHNAIDSRGCETHDIWINIDQPDPHHVYCEECGDYLDLTEKHRVEIKELKELSRLHNIERSDRDWNWGKHDERTRYLDGKDQDLLNAKEGRVILELPDDTEWGRFDPDGLEDRPIEIGSGPKGGGPFKHVMFWQVSQPEVLTRLRKVYCIDCGFLDLLAHTPQHDDDEADGEDEGETLE